MTIRKVRVSALQLKRGIGNVVRANLFGRDNILPYMAVYYANERCNAKCSFCSRETDMAGGNNKNCEIDLDRIYEVFLALRELTPSLFITGGEPLLQDNIEDMLQLARQIGFYPVTVNTNASLLHKRPDVPKYADRTVVSMHTVNVQETAKVFGFSTRVAERTLKNIRETALKARTYGNEVVVNCVLTEDNISTAYQVLDFCVKHHIPLTVVPAIVDHGPAIERADPRRRVEYIKFLGRVIAQKKSDPSSILGTNIYLERMRELGSFNCRPTSVLVISPDGRIVNPCEVKFAELPHYLGKITGRESARVTLERALDFRGKFESCPKKCLKACFAEPAMGLENPLLVVNEYIPNWLFVRQSRNG